MNYTIFINGSRGVFILKKLIKFKKYNLNAIVFCNKKIRKKLNFTPKKIKKIFIKNINSKLGEKILKNLNTDIFLLAGYPQILKKKVFLLSKIMTINLHGGPLPNYRGGSPLNWQIIHGNKKIGISLIKINSKIDGGKIIDEKFFNLKENEDIKIAHKKANNLFLKMLRTFFAKLSISKNKISYIKKIRKSKYWKQRSDKDGNLNFKEKNSNQCINFIRALTQPYPGAWIKYKTSKGNIIRLFKAKIITESSKRKKVILKKNLLLIPTKDKTIKITKFRLSKII